MADIKISALPAATIATSDDLLVIVDDPSGIPTTKKITAGDFNASSGTLSNKTLGNSNTITVKDALFTLQDDGDTTKQAKFQLSGLSTATTRTVTLPDADGTATLLGNNSTGSGSVVLSTSPVLVTPILGAAAGTSLDLTNTLSLEETGAGTDKITVQAPASIAAPYTLTLPVDDGTPNQVMTTDGSGVLSWSAPGGTGTVTSASVVSANGLAGSVANPTTTPAITLSTTVTGILSGNGTAISAASTTGSGSVVLATSPTLTTPTLGVATATTINGVTITPTTGTINVANGKTATVSNTMTLSGTDGANVNVGTGGSVAFTSNNLGAFAPTTSAQLAGVLTDETGTGSAVFATSPTLVTPNIGVATATSVNGVTINANLGITGGEFIIDGGGVAITTGIKGDLQFPFACTINSATLLADQSGSIVLDIWKAPYASYPPTIANTITASAKPTISSDVKSTDSTLTGWTTSISAGDCLRFNVDSISTIQRVALILKVTKT